MAQAKGDRLMPAPAGYGKYLYSDTYDEDRVVNSIGFLGDSITASMAYPDPPTSTVMTSQGYFEWAQLYLGRPFQLAPGDMIGLGGWTLASLVKAPQFMALLAKRPRWIMQQAGTNDLGAGATTAQMIAALRSFIEQVQGVGSVPVVSTILPRSGGFALTAGQKLVQQEVNNFLVDVPVIYPGAVCIDWAAQLYSGEDGNANPGYFQDGLHPNAVGARIMGKAMADAFTSLVTPIGPALTSSNGDPSNLLANGLMTGNSAGLATPGWSAVAVGAPPTWTATKVARTDGPGEWQRFAITVAGELRLSQVVSAAGRQADRQYIAELSFRNASFTALTRFDLYALINGGASYSMVNGGGSPDPGTFPASGILRTLPVIVPTGLASVYFYVYMNFVGAVEITQCRIRAVTLS